MKKSKRIAALLVMSIACAGMYSCAAETEKAPDSTETDTDTPETTAQEEPDNSETSDGVQIAVFGDSISTGSNLPGYKAGTDNPDIFSFGNITAEKLGARLGDTYLNLATDCDTSGDILSVVSEKLSMTAGAEIILITAGGNDLIKPMAGYIAAISGKSFQNDTAAFSYMISLADVEAELIDSFEAGHKKLLPEMDSDFYSRINDCIQNIEEMLTKLRSVAPDAKIVIQTVYDPFSDPALDSGLLPYIEENITSRYITLLDERISEAASHSGALVLDTRTLFKDASLKYTNIASSDIHPSAEGHSLIAAEILKLTGVSAG